MATAIGVLALIVAWGGWRLRPWAYRLAWVFQGLVFIVVLGGIALRIAGKPAPIGWLLLDAAFGAYNLWWLLRPDVRRAFRKRGPGTKAARQVRVWVPRARRNHRPLGRLQGPRELYDDRPDRGLDERAQWRAAGATP